MKKGLFIVGGVLLFSFLFAQMEGGGFESLFGKLWRIIGNRMIPKKTTVVIGQSANPVDSVYANQFKGAVIGRADSAKIAGSADSLNHQAPAFYLNDSLVWKGTVDSIYVYGAGTKKGTKIQKVDTAGYALTYKNDSAYADTAGYATTSGGSPPTGSAGGDLTGTYPDPTVATDKIDSTKIIANGISGTDIKWVRNADSVGNKASNYFLDTSSTAQSKSGNLTLNANVIIGNSTINDTLGLNTGIKKSYLKGINNDTSLVWYLDSSMIFIQVTDDPSIANRPAIKLYDPTGGLRTAGITITGFGDNFQANGNSYSSNNGYYSTVNGKGFYSNGDNIGMYIATPTTDGIKMLPVGGDTFAIRIISSTGDTSWIKGNGKGRFNDTWIWTDNSVNADSTIITKTSVRTDSVISHLYGQADTATLALNVDDTATVLRGEMRDTATVVWNDSSAVIRAGKVAYSDSTDLVRGQTIFRENLSDIMKTGFNDSTYWVQVAGADTGYFSVGFPYTRYGKVIVLDSLKLVGKGAYKKLFSNYTIPKKNTFMIELITGHTDTLYKAYLNTVDSVGARVRVDSFTTKTYVDDKYSAFEYYIK